VGLIFLGLRPRPPSAFTTPTSSTRGNDDGAVLSCDSRSAEAARLKRVPAQHARTYLPNDRSPALRAPNSPVPCPTPKVPYGFGSTSSAAAPSDVPAWVGLRASRT
jgi:hypothetical protein